MLLIYVASIVPAQLDDVNTEKKLLLASMCDTRNILTWELKVLFEIECDDSQHLILTGPNGYGSPQS